MARVDALPVSSDTDCPTPAAIEAEVRELTTAQQRAGVPADAQVMVSDRGATIAVAITRDGKTTVRVYRDAARDCARRAHFVSVLTVVALMPPDLGEEPAVEASRPVPEREPEPPLSAPAPTRAPAQRRTSPSHVRIELGARAEVGAPLSDTVRVALPSATLGVALGAGALRLTLGSGYAPQALARYTGEDAGSAELSRFEIALGVRYELSREPLETSFDASTLLARQELTGRSSSSPAHDTAFSAGGRLGFRVGWPTTGVLRPFLGVCVSVFPFAPAISQLPQGTVGHLPYLWLGLSGGLALAL